MTAVIDAKAFKSIRSYIDYAKTGADGAKIIFGGTYDDSKGYFIQPTLVQVDKWDSKLLKEVYLNLSLCIIWLFTVLKIFYETRHSLFF